jgi:hypothetical protein
MRTTPEGIQVIPVEYGDVVAILDSVSLRSIEEPIAIAHRLPILRDKSAASISYIQGELSVCGMTTEELDRYMRDNGDMIVRLALLMRQDIPNTDEEEYPEGEEQDPSSEGVVLGLSNGFGLTHAIYHNFLSRRTGKELRAFLKNRRIPYHAKFAKQLESVFKALNSS